MEHETKREKREIFAWEVVQGKRQKIWIFSKIQALAHKFRKICDSWINTQIKQNLLHLSQCTNQEEFVMLVLMQRSIIDIHKEYLGFPLESLLNVNSQREYCGKSKSNDNLKKYKMGKKIERDGGQGFHVVQLCESTSTR